jgi:protoporphyrinogen oxidase
MRFKVNEMEQQRPIAILGGGVAGLAAGFSARSLGLPFRIFEKAGQTGGNCVTFSQDGFRFDSGAHRLHDRDAEATGQIERLLGKSMRRVSVPSQIFYREKFLTFPFKMGDLAAKLGWPFLLRVAGEVLVSHLRRQSTAADFASVEERNYGRTLARFFLLNYSEKLWGLPCGQLAVEISGNRLAGLNLMTFFRESFLKASASARHLEGPFYYPDGGIGAVSEALASVCGSAHILVNAEISHVFHDGRCIRAVEINKGEKFACSAAMSSIPLDRFLRLLDPPPPAKVLSTAAALRFRQLALVTFFLNRDTVTRAATIYFPDPAFPFTRVYEPKNRSAMMAPPGKTSLVAEIPYDPGDQYENMEDGRLIEMVRSHLVKTGLIVERDVLAASVRRLADAYPVLEKDVEGKRREIFSYLRRFSNLKAIGRSGTFRYLHIHHLLPEAARAVAELRLQGK